MDAKDYLFGMNWVGQLQDGLRSYQSCSLEEHLLHHSNEMNLISKAFIFAYTREGDVWYGRNDFLNESDISGFTNQMTR